MDGNWKLIGLKRDGSESELVYPWKDLTLQISGNNLSFIAGKRQFQYLFGPSTAHHYSISGRTLSFLDQYNYRMYEFDLNEITKDTLRYEAYFGVINTGVTEKHEKWEFTWKREN